MTAPIVLTVCLGNICRSPTAEAALREAADEAGLDIEVRSGGTGSWHVGNPPDRRMRQAAGAEDLQLTGTAEQVDAAALRAADLVLAMDRSNLRDLQRLAAAADVTTPIRLFREFDPRAGDDLDVPDPYDGGPDGFVEVVDIARRTAREVVTKLASGELPGNLDGAGSDDDDGAGDLDETGGDTA
ncbi:MAG: low molecular weight phosphotyrosine protein phosphatase [Nitriliruptor sp.]|nr:MAG: low molecular weight phosphotyrosine protein phosphatase [Nitriliruptor sp.]